jgi:hypothetical protein
MQSRKSILYILLLFCGGCAHKSPSPVVAVVLVNNGQSVKFSGLDYAIIGEISRDSSKELWQKLIPVFRMPADTDLKSYQPVQPGSYQLADRAVVFTPDTPFLKGRAYFMRYYQFGGDTMWDYVEGKKRLGRAPHTDLIF